MKLEELTFASTTATSASAGESLAHQAVREMRRRWRRGERPNAEEILSQHAELGDSPEAAIDVIYEEFCLRHATGEHDVEQDLLRRFPHWREPLRVMFDCHRVLEPDGAVPDYPTAGDTIGGFRLIEDLGRGARGRVYLATETDLSSRPVVLKLTPLDGAEHLLLARLQHTNIVPVYSVSDDPTRRVRVLCMPYFGRATLASALLALADVPLAARTGQQIVSVIDQQNAALDEVAPGAAALQMLSQVSYVEAACWIVASLADALQHAHEHGLVHLDVKPSNILLASDGQPMLLDFHLAREPLRPGVELPDRLGGTPGYMPPEQLAAMRSLSSSQPLTQPVDARADIFALGTVLHDLLAKSCPSDPTLQRDRALQDASAASLIAPANRHPASLRQLNPHLSVGLADIIAKCLATNPDDRYATAAALADDLRRHLTDLPLLGAPNRSWTERWHKWRRRHQHAVRVAGLWLMVLVAITAGLAAAWLQVRQRTDQAVQALSLGRTQLEEHQTAAALATFEGALQMVEQVPYRRELADQLRRQIADTRRLRAVEQLRQVADQVRVQYGSTIPASQRPDQLASLCEEFWSKRSQIVASLSVNSESRVATDLLDIAIAWADLQVRLAPESELSTARRAALRTLDEAEQMFGPSPVLEFQRHLFLNEIDETSANLTLPCRTAWDHYALGRALLNLGQTEPAAAHLRTAVTLDPSGLWPNFTLGLCAHRLNRHDEAIACFSVCIGAAPPLAAPYYNRALSHRARGETHLAERDFAQARKLDPALAEAHHNR